MRALRLAAVAAVAVAAWCLMPAPHAAAKKGTAWCGATGCDSSAASGQLVSTSPARRSGPAKWRCSYEPLDIAPDMTVYDENGAALAVDGTGRWYAKECAAAGGARTGRAVYLRPRPPAEVRAEAFEHLALPAPRLTTNPAGDQIVNFPALLSVDPADWAPRESTVSVPGVTVTVRAVPERLVWRLGTGELDAVSRRWTGSVDTVVCDGPGPPWDPARAEEDQDRSCSYTWRHSSAGTADLHLPVEATIEWRVTWSTEGAAGGGELGLVARTTSTSTRVVEVHTVNV